MKIIIKSWNWSSETLFNSSHCCCFTYGGEQSNDGSGNHDDHDDHDDGDHHDNHYDGDDDDDDNGGLFQVQGMWDIQVVKDTTSCIDRVPQFTHSQITGDAAGNNGGGDDDDSDDKYDETHIWAG